MTGADQGAARPADLYAVNAEWYDAVAAQMWSALGPALEQVLAPLSTSRGTVVDVGAGTGLGTRILAGAAPTCEVVAIEPSPALRVGLMSRIMADPDLQERVTVLPTDSDGAAASLPSSLAGLLAVNMIGHLDAAARTRLWQLLGSRLDPDGIAVVGLQPPGRPEVVPERDFAGQRVGRRVYAGSARAEPAAPRQVTWHMRWTVSSDDDGLIEERTAKSTWWTVSASDLERETAAEGLRCAAADPATGLYIVNRAAPDE